MLGFVTGLRAEARLLNGVRSLVAVGGGTPAGAEGAGRKLISQGATSLISFGLAGGLDPALARGALVVPLLVVGDGETYPCDPALVMRLGGATIERLTGAASVAVTAKAKAALFRRTNAAAIDLESLPLARLARAHDLPFAVLRAVADPAARDLPPAALVALDDEGRIAPGAVVASLFRHPRQIAGLFGLARDAAAGRRALAGQLAKLAGS